MRGESIARKKIRTTAQGGLGISLNPNVELRRSTGGAYWLIAYKPDSVPFDSFAELVRTVSQIAERLEAEAAKSPVKRKPRAKG